MTDHPLEFKPWQLNASLLILPMEPQPKKGAHKRSRFLYWEHPEAGDGIAWIKNKPFPVYLLPDLPCQTGDHIYHQEGWIGGYSPVGNIHYKSSASAADLDWLGADWCPASKMPYEFSRYRFKILSVDVRQHEKITQQDLYDAGIGLEGWEKITGLKRDWDKCFYLLRVEAIA